MARRPEMWYWEERGRWYVTIKGKRYRLAADRKQAEKEFYRLMAAEDELSDGQKRNMVLADACEAYAASRDWQRPNTQLVAERQLSRLAGSPFARLRLSEVDPEQVEAWIRKKDFTDGGRVTSSGDAARHVLYRYTKTFMRWCRNRGYLQVDRFAGRRNPWTIPPRDKVMSDEEYERVMSRNRVSDEFKEVLRFVRGSGIRPGEFAMLEARHLDPVDPVAHFPWQEHKTGTKTHRVRRVFFQPELWAIVQEYRKLRPSGPIFARKNGKPWTAKAISNLWNQLKHSMGLKCVLYQARHAFATDMVMAGHKAEVVAIMLGHVRPDTTIVTYFKAPEHAMLQAAAGAAEADAARMARAQARIDERKQEQINKRRARVMRWERKQKAALRARPQVLEGAADVGPPIRPLVEEGQDGLAGDPLAAVAHPDAEAGDGA